MSIIENNGKTLFLFYSVQHSKAKEKIINII